MIRQAFLAGVLMVGSAVRCFAPPPIVTGDVPTARKETFEWYLGVRYQDTGGIERQLPFTELVYGVTDRAEVIVEIPYLSREGEHGIGDIVTGTKIVLVPETERRPGVAFSYEVNLPTGDEERGLGEGAFQHELRLRAQKTWAWFTPIINFGYTFVGEPEIDGMRQERCDVWRASFAQEWQVVRRTKLLSEIYYFSSSEPGGVYRLAANIGFKYKLRDDFTVHAAVGKSLREENQGGPDLRVYAGFKYEFGAPWRTTP